MAMRNEQDRAGALEVDSVREALGAMGYELLRTKKGHFLPVDISFL